MGAAEPTMESRGRRPRTPERQRPAPRKVPVVYYLTRSRHLEHPHFVEVPVASPEGLYLRGQWNCSFSFYLRSCARLMANGDYLFGVLQMSLTISTRCAARAWPPCTRGPARGNARLALLCFLGRDVFLPVFLGCFFLVVFATC